jgi:REP element-mobilizing transposase RayT
MIHFYEKKHRLPAEYYHGEVSVAFTLCLKGAVRFRSDVDFVTTCKEILPTVAEQSQCIIPIYCFMPDHQHILVTGTQPPSDAMQVVIAYKQHTGFWLSENQKAMRWQKDFYDHVIKGNEDIRSQALYILGNPVRKGIVKHWSDYPYSGSIGCSLDDVLSGLI